MVNELREQKNRLGNTLVQLNKRLTASMKNPAVIRHITLSDFYEAGQQRLEELNREISIAEMSECDHRFISVLNKGGQYQACIKCPLENSFLGDSALVCRTDMQNEMITIFLKSSKDHMFLDDVEYDILLARVLWQQIDARFPKISEEEKLNIFLSKVKENQQKNQDTVKTLGSHPLIGS